MDEIFTLMLQRLIDEKGMNDSATYKKTNLDGWLFLGGEGDVGGYVSEYGTCGVCLFTFKN
jgi:hypothetical protein